MDEIRGTLVPSGAAWIAAAVIFMALGAGLRPDTFFVGDPGVKLIAARNASDRPGTPLEIPLPVIGGERVSYVEPFFAVHGDHTHAVTAEAFPLFSAPFIALFGIRGAYILPALGFFLTLGASRSIARSLDRRRSTVAVMLAVWLGTPFLFYGMEFWEHAPAVGVAALATAVLTRSSTTEGTVSRGAHRGRAFSIGFLYGVAILLRPEAVCFVVAAIIASRLLPAPPRASALAIGIVGLLIAILPLEIYSIAHFHSVVPPHIAAHETQLKTGWIAERAVLISTWFVPRGTDIGSWWGAALLAFLAVALVRRGSGRDGQAFLLVLGVIDIALVFLTAPNDGGSQWGPRYMLLAFVPASIVLADAVHAASRQRIAGLMLVVLVMGAGVWAERDGYRQLRGTKAIYGRMLDFVRREVPPQGTAVTDIWWLDQVAAAATDERRILFVTNAEIGREAIRRLDETKMAEVTVIRSREESRDVGGLETSCYVASSVREIRERGLVAIHLTRLTSSAAPPCATAPTGSPSEPPPRP